MLRTVQSISQGMVFIGVQGTLHLDFLPDGSANAVLTTVDGGTYAGRATKSRTDPEEITLTINPPAAGIRAVVVDLMGGKRTTAMSMPVV